MGLLRIFKTLIGLHLKHAALIELDGKNIKMLIIYMGI